MCHSLLFLAMLYDVIRFGKEAPKVRGWGRLCVRMLQVVGRVGSQRVAMYSFFFTGHAVACG